MLQRVSQSLALKLLFVITLVGLIGVGTVALFAQQATQREFRQFVVNREFEGFAEQIRRYYERNQTLEGVTSALRSPPRRPNPSLPPGPPPENQSAPAERRRPPQPPQPDSVQGPNALFLLLDEGGCVVTPVTGFAKGDCLGEKQLANGKPIRFDEKIIGTIITTNPNPQFRTIEQAYITAMNSALRNGAIVATLLSLLLGLFLARYLTRPLKEMTTAINAMTDGELKQEVTVRSEDELGQLASAFNQMSTDVSRANQLRRQMTADVAHDLRNPIGVLSGYIEAMRDGVLKPTDARLETMHEEINLLQHLVDDLWTLARADAGELQLNCVSTAPRELLDRTASAYLAEASLGEVNLAVDVDDRVPNISVDPERMIQVLGNLVSNALRHTPAGGTVQLLAISGRTQNEVALLVRDSGSGIDPEAIPYIFERFYRADSAREQNNGESGLGLAIAKMIVENHQGLISVSSTLGRGTEFCIRLPAA